jgi:flagellar basal body-associated protein FliL
MLNPKKEDETKKKQKITKTMTITAVAAISMLAATIIVTSSLAAITQQTAFAAKPQPVTICHVTKVDPETHEFISGQTITVNLSPDEGQSSVRKHLAHGDFLGECPT